MDKLQCICITTSSSPHTQTTLPFISSCSCTTYPAEPIPIETPVQIFDDSTLQSFGSVASLFSHPRNEGLIIGSPGSYYPQKTTLQRRSSDLLRYNTSDMNQNKPRRSLKGVWGEGERKSALTELIHGSGGR